MTWLHCVFFGVLAGTAAIRAESPDAPPPKKIPPVLRRSEPMDNGVVMLPGPSAPLRRPVVADPSPSPPAAKARPAAVKRPATPLVPAPQPKIERVPAKPVETATRLEPPKQPQPPPPKAPESQAGDKERKPKPAFPPDFTKDSADFCQKQISHWKEADARSLLGEPLRQRPALGDDRKSVNGRIYAFSDPTGRYKELELDFDRTTGKLRTVFGYPHQLTWNECLRRWGNNVTAADARQGRIFYSYLDRRLDVLVDPRGNVISVGLY